MNVHDASVKKQLKGGFSVLSETNSKLSQNFLQNDRIKKDTFILIISKPNIYVLNVLLYFKNYMPLHFPKAFFFQVLFTPLILGTKEILSQILTNSVQSMLQYCQICSFPFLCLQSLSCCNHCLSSKHLFH